MPRWSGKKHIPENNFEKNLEKATCNQQVIIYHTKYTKGTAGQYPERSLTAKLTPMKAIKAKCMECSAGQRSEVRNCTVTTCALYGYRNGHRPKDEENIEENNQTEKVPS